MLPQLANWTTYGGAGLLFVSLGAFVFALLRFQQRAITETRADRDEDRASHRAEMAGLRTQLAELRQENAELRSEFVAERARCDGLDREVQSLKHVLSQNGLMWPG